jgi:hypothetical protein
MKEQKSIISFFFCGQTQISSIYSIRDLNFLFFSLPLSFLIGNKSLATTSSTTQARFITQGHTYRAVVGETLTLPCEVENIGKFYDCNIVIDVRIDVGIVLWGIHQEMKIY